MIIMTLRQVRDVFVSVLPDATFHYNANGSKLRKYIVWAEDGQAGASHSDNKMREQIIEGTVDLYTKEEYDSTFDSIQTVMDKANLSWRWNSTQPEKDTGYIHHEWVWQVVRAVG